MKDEELTRISIGGSFFGVAGPGEGWCVEVVGSVHVAHGVTPGSVHHRLSISRSLAIAVAVGVSVSLLHTVSVPHVVHVVHVPVVVHVVHVVTVTRVHVVHVPVVHVPVGARVHGPVVTIGVTITIVAVVGISISFSSGFRGCKGSKADHDGNLDHCSSFAFN